MRTLRNETRFWANVLFLLDCLLLTLMWVACDELRRSGVLISLSGELPSRAEHLQVFLFAPLIWAGAYYHLRLYRLRGLESRLSEYWQLFKGTSALTLGLLSIGFLIFKLEWSRLFLAYFWLSSGLFLLLLRAAFREALRFTRRINLNRRHFLILGTGETARFIQNKLWQHPELGMDIRGYISHRPEDVGDQVSGTDVIGTIGELKTLIREHDIDQLFICPTAELRPRVQGILEDLQEEFVDISLVSDLPPMEARQGRVEEFEGLPILAVNHSPIAGWGGAAKRGIDVAVSGAALLALSPLLVLVALIIRLSSRGPALYAQERMGLGGRTFTLLKFRTMVKDAEKVGQPVWSHSHDPRCTRFGRFLRLTGIDELPQLLHVLTGEMSLVGPRPERPVFVDVFRREIPRYMQRHRIKSGITGWAQIHGLRGDTSIEERLDHDLYYSENWSVLLDLKILIRTICGGFLNRSA